MPRFDNFTNQLDKLPRPVSAAAYIDAASDAILVTGRNGRAIVASMSQDMSAFMHFMALGSPNTAMTVSTLSAKGSFTFGFPAKVFNAAVTMWLVQTTGAAAGFDIMRSDTRVTQSASLIDDTTVVGSALVLPVGSNLSITSIASIYSVPGSATLIRNYYATSGTGIFQGGANVLLHALVK